MSEGKGHCLCGAVKFTVKPMNNQVDACHCGRCGRWGGGPLLNLGCGAGVTFEGEENIAVYDSSERAEREFCKQCGSHSFDRLKETNDQQLTVDLFDNQNNFQFNGQVFIDRKPAFYNFANKTTEMTEAEVIEKLHPAGTHDQRLRPVHPIRYASGLAADTQR